MNKQQKIIQAVGELAFPIIGMFYLDWSLYFIILYYLFDSLANEVFFQVEIKSIYTFKGKKKEDKQRWLRSTISQIFFFVFVSSIAHLAMLNIYPNINRFDEFIAFLMYTEEFLPVPQVYVLLPLILLPKFMNYKNEFVVKQKVRVLTVKRYVFIRRKTWLLTLSLASSLYAISFLLQISPVIGLFLLLLPKFIYDVWFSEV